MALDIIQLLPDHVACWVPGTDHARLWEVKRFKPSLTYDLGIVLGGISDYDKIAKVHNFNKNAQLNYLQNKAKFTWDETGC